MQIKNSYGLVAFVLGAALAIGISASSVASAATISDSAVFSTSDRLIVTDDPTIPGPTSSQSNASDIIQLNFFNASLGTLTGVSFELTSALIEDTFLTQAVNHGEGSASTDFVLTVSDAVTGSLFGQTFIHNTTCNDPFVPCMDRDDSNSSAPFNGLTNPVPLAVYQGIGTFDVTMNQLIDLSFFTIDSNIENTGSLFDGGWSGTLEVTYTYNTVVPVPAAVWLFGSGLFSLVGIGRCKKA